MRRHLGTLIAAVVVAPLAWILLAAGQDRSAQVFVEARDGGSFDTNDFVRPLLLLAAAGILLGLIGTLRFSPLGAGVTGAAYAGSYLCLLISPSRVLGVLDHTLTVDGHAVNPATPVRTGTALLLGSLLLVGVASAQRWRRWPRPATDGPPDAVPDGVMAPAAQQDRPLGADGLGLTRPAGTGEPDPTSSYPAEREEAMVGARRWAGLLSNDDSADAQRQSDHTRHRST